MNTNNIYYRFRHYLHKEFFELVGLAVSAVNGCELCVSSHARSVLQHGSTESRVLEAVKLAAVIKGLITILN